MPNFFVEAVTVHGGQGPHVETKELIVPPEKRVLNVEVQPSSATTSQARRARSSSS